MFYRLSEDHVAFSFKDNAPSVPVVLGFLQKARTAIHGSIDQSGLEAKRAMARRHGGGEKETGKQGRNHGGMRHQWVTMHKVPSINGRTPPTGTSGKKFLENSMNWPRHSKKNLTFGTKAVKKVPKRR